MSVTRNGHKSMSGWWPLVNPMVVLVQAQLNSTTIGYCGTHEDATIAAPVLLLLLLLSPSMLASSARTAIAAADDAFCTVDWGAWMEA